MARFLDAVVLAASGPELEDDPDAPDAHERPPEDATGLIGWCAARTEGLEWLHGRLDTPSRDLMVALFAVAAVGPRKLALPLAGTPWRSALDLAASLVADGHAGPGGRDGVHRFDLSPVGIPIVLDTDVADIARTFLLGQYRSPVFPSIAAGPGDVVVDGGAGRGAATLNFADGSGPHGRVVAFEADPALGRALVSNLALNPELAARVEHRPARLGSRLQEADGAGGVTALDDLVRARELPGVDFLKLDLGEGGLAALVGARHTLARDRPRVAIALRHRTDDWLAIPRLLDSIGAGYRFTLGLASAGAERPVLFAWADRS